MLEMSMALNMSMRMTPALFNLAQMLPLPRMELYYLVQQELSDNPALEELESLEAEWPELERQFMLLGAAAAEPDSDAGTLADDDAGDADPLLFVAAPCAPADLLLADLRVILPAHDYPIALLLVGSLDERGFLQESPQHIAHLLGISQEDVARVLRQLQELAPGIATCDVRACLLAQLDSLAESGHTCPSAREIIGGHLDALGARQYRQIAQALGIPIEHIEAVHDFVQRYLWPYPALPSCDFDSAWQSDAHSLPDVAIVAQGCDFAVDVLHSPRRILRLNPLYQDLARRAATLDDATREHVQGYVRRARIFLTNLRQREKTLQQIVEAIVEHQDAFLRYGMRHLRPLTRATIAAELGIHESTVSRAMSNKLVLLPNGVPLPMSEFFVAARSAQDALRELISNENRPYSDAQLARLLNEQGFRITRRTVAKYRDQMRILPSRLR